ncbi:right-handed parallel beta-helix repeat-containing protein [Granulosicoccaceae sp. 1_MG-2023]|nr:right-handed parallel beta-helix repeat-containing protein [Granulosicoccaceae sp. 1_MG-2023]
MRALQPLPDDSIYLQTLTIPAQSNPACPAFAPGSTVTLDKSLTLPPGCRYERLTLRINKPGITLDCNGALLNGLDSPERQPAGRAYASGQAPQTYAILIAGHENAARPVRNVTVRNCQLLNYRTAVLIVMGMEPATYARARRDGQVKAAAQLQSKAPGDIRLDNLSIVNSHDTGVYLQRFVSGVSLENSRILGSGGVGLYLEAGTRDALIRNNRFEGNGFASYDAQSRQRSRRLSDTVRREAIAVDGSQYNTIRANLFRNNADGGVYLYKNCWEHADSKAREMPRDGGADHNLIEDNRFENETTGVWLAERADRDLSGFHCGDPLYAAKGTAKFYRDYAQYNTVRGNQFTGNQVGIRVQDDHNTLTANRFEDAEEADIVIGSRIRRQQDQPVRETELQDNRLSSAQGVVYLSR